MRPIPALIAASSVIFTAGLLTFLGSIPPGGGSLMILLAILAYT